MAGISKLVVTQVKVLSDEPLLAALTLMASFTVAGALLMKFFQ